MSLLIDIHKKYKNFSLDIKFDNDGKLLGLLGASGCGKSLTLRCIAGIENPDRGKIILNDRILYDSENGINIPPRHRNIGLLFQNYALFPNMTVKENIEIGVRNKKNKKIIVEKMNGLFRLEGMLNRYPNQLSGGEQQRVALARIMAYEPEVLMLDEPFSALDSFLKDQLQQELLEVLKEYRGDVLMVSHSRDELYRFCNTIAVINRGQIVEIGNKSVVFSKPTDITTAKLTGCKNISRAVRISDYEVNALDWSLCLKTSGFVSKDIHYVGIRAHNIKSGPSGEGENMIPVSLVGFSEGPFENNLILKNKNQVLEEGKLWWIVTKQDWNNTLHEQFPSHITLPKEHILLLADNS